MGAKDTMKQGDSCILQTGEDKHEVKGTGEQTNKQNKVLNPELYLTTNY